LEDIQPTQGYDHNAATLHIVALSLTKLGDALVSSRLVLAWMLGAIGAPGITIALLVPVRESLALLPQIGFAQWIGSRRRRKGFWIAGSAAQGATLLLMVPALLLLPPTLAGWSIIALLAVFSLARALCSITIKDVMGRTIEKQRRGRVSGTAASVAGVVTLVGATALALMPAQERRDEDIFAAILITASLLWLSAAWVYGLLREPTAPRTSSASQSAGFFEDVRGALGDRDLTRFLAARILLLATALSIPYLVLMLQRAGDANIGGLAVLLAAEGLSGLLSGRVWGIWSDHAAHRVMALAALLSALLMLVVLGFDAAAPQWLASPIAGGAILFIAATAHHGVRIARSTYLIDMTNDTNRARYTAVANTVMGPMLLAGGVLGVIDTGLGTHWVLGLLVLFALAGVWRSLTLRHV
jgi:hypothetical protein